MRIDAWLLMKTTGQSELLDMPAAPKAGIKQSPFFAL